jgi:HK97 gp10 family phage protein
MIIVCKIELLFSIPAIQGALRRSGKNIKNYFTKAAERSILRVWTNTSPLVPVDTAALKSNVYKKTGFIYGELTYNQSYAVYVHYGTWKMKARPFLEKGSNVSRAFIEKEFEKAAEKTLQDIAK